MNDNRDDRPDLTVCLCTHNPRRDYLGRTLTALAAQSLAPGDWELVIVDNASAEPVQAWVDLSGLATLCELGNVRVVREDELGLTPARLRAIAEARAEALVFVDDDNLLAPDYLEHAIAILRERPELGAAGGRLIGEFEIEPPGWLRRFLPYLAVGDHGDAPIVSAEGPGRQPWHPVGAGLVIRRELALDYARKLAGDAQRRQLDRRGSSLASAGDIDLVLGAIDAGRPVGYFPQLALTHLIPRERLTFSYMKRMIASAITSSEQLKATRGIERRTRPLPLDLAISLALCLRSGCLHPLTWLLEFQIPLTRHRTRETACR